MRLWTGIILGCVATVAVASQYDQAILSMKSLQETLQQTARYNRINCGFLNTQQLKLAVDLDNLKSVTSEVQTISQRMNHAKSGAQALDQNVSTRLDASKHNLHADISQANALMGFVKKTQSAACKAKPDAQAASDFKHAMHDYEVLAQSFSRLNTSINHEIDIMQNSSFAYLTLNGGREQFDRVDDVIARSQHRLKKFDRYLKDAHLKKTDLALRKAQKLYTKVSQQYIASHDLSAADKQAFSQFDNLYKTHVLPHAQNYLVTKACVASANSARSQFYSVYAPMSAVWTQAQKKETQLLKSSVNLTLQPKFKKELTAVSNLQIQLQKDLKSIQSQLQKTSSCLGLQFVSFAAKKSSSYSASRLAADAKKIKLLQQQAVKLLQGNEQHFTHAKDRLHQLDKRLRLLSQHSVASLKKKLKDAEAMQSRLHNYQTHMQALSAAVQNSTVYVCAVNDEVASNTKTNYRALNRSALSVVKQEQLQFSTLSQDYDLSQRTISSYHADMKMSKVSQDESLSKILQQMNVEINDAWNSIQPSYKRMVASLALSNKFEGLIQDVELKYGSVQSKQFKSLSDSYFQQADQQKGLYYQLKEMTRKQKMKLELVKREASSYSTKRQALLSAIVATNKKIADEQKSIDHIYQSAERYEKQLNKCLKGLESQNHFVAQSEAIYFNLNTCQLEKAYQKYQAISPGPDKVMLQSRLSTAFSVMKLFKDAKQLQAKGQLPQAIKVLQQARHESKIPACRRKADMDVIKMAEQVGLDPSLHRIWFSYDSCDLSMANARAKVEKSLPQHLKKDLYFERHTQRLLTKAQQEMKHHNIKVARDDLLAAYDYTRNPACRMKIDAMIATLSSIE